jgi:hypothetical protein
MVWTTGITAKRWIESQFYKAVPGGNDENYRESNYSPVKLSGKAARKILFETFELPAYIHEVVSVAFRHDYTAINGVRVHADENYNEPSWRARYPFANSSIAVEQVGWFKEYNGDDTGLVEPGGYIKVNGGYMKR